MAFYIEFQSFRFKGTNPKKKYVKPPFISSSSIVLIYGKLNLGVSPTTQKSKIDFKFSKFRTHKLKGPKNGCPDNWVLLKVESF